MTEQQIENLKKILSTSEQQPNSAELDDKIMTAAVKYAPIKKRLIDFLRIENQQFNVISSVGLSILLTVALFFSLSFILSKDEISQDQSYIVDRTDFEFQVEANDHETSIVTSSPIEFIERPISADARDQLLAGMQPLDIKAILDSMEFTHTNDRELAEMAVTQAMNDIRFMVMEGELNNARDRYDRLRRSCSTCTLPETLEALVFNQTSSSSRS